MSNVFREISLLALGVTTSQVSWFRAYREARREKGRRSYFI